MDGPHWNLLRNPKVNQLQTTVCHEKVGWLEVGVHDVALFVGKVNGLEHLPGTLPTVSRLTMHTHPHIPSHLLPVLPDVVAGETTVAENMIKVVLA